MTFFYVTVCQNFNTVLLLKQMCTTSQTYLKHAFPNHDFKDEPRDQSC